MMIGTCERRRSSRHTSMPETLGSMTSSSTMSGRVESNRARASAPSRAACTRKPSRFRPTVRASTKDSSSSTTNTVDVDSGTLCFLPFGDGGNHLTGGRSWDGKGEDRALAFARLDAHLSAVVVSHVPHDRQPQSGTPSVAGPGPVDAVEALEDAIEV